jgi:pSer/pThr/pTyr-binding forkhead associated (FHA) protein
MSITVIVASGRPEETRLTFDGTQRVVIGRGAGCDVRLPDASVSHRHATLQAQGADFVLVDEASTNGTFVGAVRVAPRTSRVVSSGDVVCLGRVSIELRIDQSPVTRDVAAATRDLALALVACAMEAMGEDRTARVRVVEGRDQGTTLALAEEGRAYLVGRGAQCDLPIADGDVSREHVRIERRAGGVLVRDLGAKQGTWIGEARVPSDRDVAWRPALMMRIGRTVLALDEPVQIALAQIEALADTPVDAKPAPAAAPPPAPTPAPASKRPSIEPGRVSSAPMAAIPTEATAPAPRRKRSGWSAADLMVMAAAICVIAASLAGLVWLLRS